MVPFLKDGSIAFFIAMPTETCKYIYMLSGVAGQRTTLTIQVRLHEHDPCENA